MQYIMQKHRYVAEVMSLVFLINRKYSSFYKWMHRTVKETSFLGNNFASMISEFIEQTDYGEKRSIIEKICTLIIDALKYEGLSDSESDFLLDHAYSIHAKIMENEFRKRFPLAN